MGLHKERNVGFSSLVEAGQVTFSFCRQQTSLMDTLTSTFEFFFTRSSEHIAIHDMSSVSASPGKISSLALFEFRRQLFEDELLPILRLLVPFFHKRENGETKENSQIIP